MVKKLFAFLLLTAALAVGQNTAFYTDRALGVNPFSSNSTNGTPTPIFLGYAQVRVCTLPTSGIPCNTPATINDINGNPLIIIGGNFGQLQTDVVGRFSFQCQFGLYQIQVEASGSNTPNLSYPITCPGGPSAPSILGTNNVFTGTNTFQNTVTVLNLNRRQYASLQAGADGGQKIANAYAALGGAAGIVDATDLTGTVAWGTTLTITSPVTILLPCTTITPTVQMLNIQSSGVHVLGCGVGTGEFSTNGAVATKISASGLGGGVNLIQVQSISRGTQVLARLSDFKLRDMLIDMGGAGNRAVYTTSCWDCEISYVTVVNANGDGGVYIEGGLASDGTLDAASYQYKLDHVTVEPMAGNSTTHAFFFDASHGEIGYMNGDFLRGDGPCCTGTVGGSDAYFILAGSAASVGFNFDQAVFNNIHGGNTAAGTYGIKMQAPGNWAAGTGGEIFDVIFNNAQLEQLGVAASGTGFGCVDGSGTPNGTGCGSNEAIILTAFNYTLGIDSANVGANFACISCFNSLNLGPYLAMGDYFQRGPNATQGLLNFNVNLHASGSGDFFPVMINPKLCDFGTSGSSNCDGAMIDLSNTVVSGTTPQLMSTLVIRPPGAGGGGTPSATHGIYCANDPTIGTTRDCIFNLGTLRQEGDMFIDHGVNTNSAGFKHIHSTAGCATAAAVFSSCTTTITFSAPFADNLYTVTCNGTGVNAGVPLNGGQTNRLAASIGFITVNATAVAAQFGAIDCIAVHN